MRHSISTILLVICCYAVQAQTSDTTHVHSDNNIYSEPIAPKATMTELHQNFNMSSMSTETLYYNQFKALQVQTDMQAASSENTPKGISIDYSETNSSLKPNAFSTYGALNTASYMIQVSDQEQKNESLYPREEVNKMVHITNQENKAAFENKAIIVSSGEELQAGQRIVNGPSQYDSRIEMRYLNTNEGWAKKVWQNGQSVAIVVLKNKLHQISKTYFQIDDHTTLGKTYTLCPGEAFAEQPVLGLGTAIVTARRTMLTASHVFARPLNEYVVVFGFEILNKIGAYEKLIIADSIYYPKTILKTSAELDITSFSVDRDIKSPALQWSKQPPKSDDDIYMIGYPYGLPKKLAANAGVEQNDDRNVFYTTLDAFQGNSGSPVFSLSSHEVIGILVGGQVDFKWNGTCNYSNICKAPYCEGEKAVRIDAVKNFLSP